ncbi:MAG: hypothetical protein JJU37_10260 [Balneolaceae bacterium]|nr:hypothetical protein [Balneolaceae bacterium]
MNRQDKESVLYWLEKVETIEDYDLFNDYEGLVSISRYWLSQNNTYRAGDLINSAEELLASREENQGPRLARLHALKAEKQCQNGETSLGIETLDQAESLWQEAEGQQSGIQTLRNYAQSCS